jgi:hypothetical protein
MNTTLERPAARARASPSCDHQPSALALLPPRALPTHPIPSDASAGSAASSCREQVSALAAPLDLAKVQQREQGRSLVS